MNLSSQYSIHLPTMKNFFFELSFFGLRLLKRGKKESKFHTHSISKKKARTFKNDQKERIFLEDEPKPRLVG